MTCPNFNPPAGSRFYIKKGYYETKYNHDRFPRYQCKNKACRRTFSSRASLYSYRDKKPYLNQEIFRWYASGTTQRRLAIVLGVARSTVARKFRKIAAAAQEYHCQKLFNGELKSNYIQFDEMMSYEHTKYKQVSIVLAVRVKTGEILDVEVEPIRCRGSLSKTLPAKFSYWGTQPKTAVGAVLSNLAKYCVRNLSACTIETDDSRFYLNTVKRFLPGATHSRIPGRGKKKSVPSPKKQPKTLFVLNYVCAKIRNDLSRMARRTWVTTKDWTKLRDHLYVYIAWNNGYQLRI
ncbi:MAG: transposase [Bdellovibrionota bacterium]